MNWLIAFWFGRRSSIDHKTFCMLPSLSRLSFFNASSLPFLCGVVINAICLDTVAQSLNLVCPSNTNCPMISDDTTSNEACPFWIAFDQSCAPRTRLENIPLFLTPVPLYSSMLIGIQCLRAFSNTYCVDDAEILYLYQSNSLNTILLIVVFQLAFIPSRNNPGNIIFFFLRYRINIIVAA